MKETKERKIHIKIESMKETKRNESKKDRNERKKKRKKETK